MSILHPLFRGGRVSSKLGRSSSLCLYIVSCIITSRSSCSMVVLIAEVFVIAPCAFQCTSLMWVTALCVPFVVVERPEVEGECH